MSQVTLSLLTEWELPVIIALVALAGAWFSPGAARKRFCVALAVTMFLPFSFPTIVSNSPPSYAPFGALLIYPILLPYTLPILAVSVLLLCFVFWLFGKVVGRILKLASGLWKCAKR